MMGKRDSIMMGGGRGSAGLWIDEDFIHGCRYVAGRTEEDYWQAFSDSFEWVCSKCVSVETTLTLSDIYPVHNPPLPTRSVQVLTPYVSGSQPSSSHPPVSSAPSVTFNNDCLASSTDFLIIGMEVWGFVQQDL